MERVVYKMHGSSTILTNDPVDYFLSKIILAASAYCTKIQYIYYIVKTGNM